YHVIFVCKYKKSALNNLEGELKEVLFDVADVASNSDFEILEMEYDLDHVYLLVKSYPKISILSIIRK
ncbi:MAG: transposase, partial [Methanosarcinaceae archaeon]|nr:transposase [Methanosarcinaceae archaeon]